MEQKLVEELERFKNVMAFVLGEQEKSGKTGWDSMTIDDLFKRLEQEYEELHDCYRMYQNAVSGNRKDLALMGMCREAIDLANFCLFINHRIQKDVPQPHIDEIKTIATQY